MLKMMEINNKTFVMHQINALQLICRLLLLRHMNQKRNHNSITRQMLYTYDSSHTVWMHVHMLAELLWTCSVCIQQTVFQLDWESWEGTWQLSHCLSFLASFCQNLKSYLWHQWFSLDITLKPHVLSSSVWQLTNNNSSTGINRVCCLSIDFQYPDSDLYWCASCSCWTAGSPLVIVVLAQNWSIFCNIYHVTCFS